MIELTRLNGTHFTLNCELIKSVEESPDTTVTLTGGEKLIVHESLEELNRRMTAYRGAVLRAAWGRNAPGCEGMIDGDSLYRSTYQDSLYVGL